MKIPTGDDSEGNLSVMPSYRLYNALKPLAGSKLSIVMRLIRIVTGVWLLLVAAWAQAQDFRTGHRSYERLVDSSLSVLKSIKYKRATWYRFNCSVACPGGEKIVCDDSILNSKREFAQTVELPGTDLEKKEIRFLMQIFTNRRTYIWQGLHEGVACYEPRDALVFYDDTNEPVACINICLACFQIEYEVFNPAGRSKGERLVILSYGIKKITQFCSRQNIHCCSNQ